LLEPITLSLSEIGIKLLPTLMPFFSFDSLSFLSLDYFTHLPALKTYSVLFLAAPVALFSVLAYLLVFLLVFFVILFAGQWGLIWGRFLLVLIVLLFAAWLFLLRYVVHRRRKMVNLRDLKNKKHDLFCFGAKAVNLGRLIRAGEKVPPGFALSARLFSHDEKRRVQIAAKIARRICKKMPARRIVVRSSFRGEDSDRASFAGAFLSVRDVNTKRKGDVADALMAVWDSHRSVAHRLYSDRSHAEAEEIPGLSIICQEQIDAKVAGFAFSVDVTTGRRECRLIETDRGPRALLRIDRITGARELLAGAPDILSDQILSSLGNVIDRVAEQFGRPVEIEWGWNDGDLYLFQVRPVLAIPELETWVNKAEWGFDRPLTPMSWSVLGDEKELTALLAGPWGRWGTQEQTGWLKLAHGRLYVLWNRFTRAEQDRQKEMWRINAIGRFVCLLLKNPKVSDDDLSGETAAIENLVASLRTEIKKQQEDLFRADVLAAWIARLSSDKIDADLLPQMFPLGKEHPLMQIGSELSARLSTQSEEEMVQKYGFLSRHDMELAEPRAENDPSILADYCLSHTKQGNDVDWSEIDETLCRLQPYVTVRWLPRLVRLVGRRYRQNRINVERRHLSILKINHRIRNALLRQADDLGIEVDDIFYLTWREFQQRQVDFNLLAQRKKLLRANISLDPKMVLHFRGTKLIDFSAARERELSSPGWVGVGIGDEKVIGVLVDHKADAFSENEIILLPDTHTRWLHLFNRKKPIVAMTGGILSHLANVARELNIPFFVLSRAAEIRPGIGMKVEIDFSKGMMKRV
jgi:phosphohistidine swiveling domain-containing protein